MPEPGTLTVPVTDADHVQGPPPGPGVVELVEYGDFQCPHCSRAAAVVNQLRAERPDALRFVYRHFPLSRLHPLARKAAEASEAAHDQGQFWPMHDLLFEKAPDLAVPQLLEHAGQLGLDVPRVEAQLASDAHAQRIQQDTAGGARSGVNGTPTFFVNGRRHNGPYQVEALRAALDAAVTRTGQNPN